MNNSLNEILILIRLILIKIIDKDILHFPIITKNIHIYLITPTI